MANLIDEVLSGYISAYRELIAVEPTEENSATLSFPFHYSGDHRIELTVTKIGKNRYVISDLARTMSELRDAGYRMGSTTRKRIEELASRSGLHITKDHLLAECDEKGLGLTIQVVLESAKTIADAYLVHGKPRGVAEDELARAVRTILNERKVIYKEKEKVRGEIERHSVDFYAPPNGNVGLAVSILSSYNTHLIAEAWGFKCEDIRRVNPTLRIGLVYDVEGGKWADESKTILEEKADMAVPGNSLRSFDENILKMGIGKASR